MVLIYVASLWKGVLEEKVCELIWVFHGFMHTLVIKWDLNFKLATAKIVCK